MSQFTNKTALMSPVIQEVVDIITCLYQHGWNERNGGNLSYILTDAEVQTIVPQPRKVLRTFTYPDVDFRALANKHFLVTSSGSYFKNFAKLPADNLGLLRVNPDGRTLELLWGYSEGGVPTSEVPTHLLCHVTRLAQDPLHRLVIHAHPTNIIAMTHVCPLDEKFFTEKVWKMQTESLVVLPEGIAVLPWILCGGAEIGLATSAKMRDYRAVIWSQHGLFCAGKTLDEVYGLIETIEKAADIYIRTAHLPVKQSITNEQLRVLAKAFKVEYKKGIID